MEKMVAEIKLCGITFVATRWMENEGGEITTAKRTNIGQLVYDCEMLPNGIAEQLRDLIQQAYLEQIVPA